MSGSRDVQLRTVHAVFRMGAVDGGLDGVQGDFVILRAERACITGELESSAPRECPGNRRCVRLFPSGNPADGTRGCVPPKDIKLDGRRRLRLRARRRGRRISRGERKQPRRELQPVAGRNGFPLSPRAPGFKWSHSRGSKTRNLSAVGSIASSPSGPPLWSLAGVKQRSKGTGDSLGARWIRKTGIRVISRVNRGRTGGCKRRVRRYTAREKQRNGRGRAIRTRSCLAASAGRSAADRRRKRNGGEVGWAGATELITASVL